MVKFPIVRSIAPAELLQTRQVNTPGEDTDHPTESSVVLFASHGGMTDTSHPVTKPDTEVVLSAASQVLADSEAMSSPATVTVTHAFALVPPGRSAATKARNVGAAAPPEAGPA